MENRYEIRYESLINGKWITNKVQTDEDTVRQGQMSADIHRMWRKEYKKEVKDGYIYLTVTTRFPKHSGKIEAMREVYKSPYTER